MKQSLSHFWPAAVPASAVTLLAAPAVSALLLAGICLLFILAGVLVGLASTRRAEASEETSVEPGFPFLAETWDCR